MIRARSCSIISLTHCVQYSRVSVLTLPHSVPVVLLPNNPGVFILSSPALYDVFAHAVIIKLFYVVTEYHEM